MRHYLITAGTGNYDSAPPLPEVPGDLAEVAAAFRSLHYQQALELTDPRTDQFRRRLDDWVREEFRSDDVLVVYYTGHGERDTEGRHYLLCADSVPGRPSGTALATEDVVRILTSEGVRRLLLIVDTCYAGYGSIDAVRQVATAIHLQLMTTSGEDRAQLAAFAVIAAARPREPAQDGAFAKALAAALTNRELAGPRQRFLSLKQVVDEVNAGLRDRGVLQHASYGLLMDFDFLPNPCYEPDLPPVGVDLAEQRMWVSAEGRRRREELSGHFGPRGRGAEDARTEPGHYFVGRVEILRLLVSWLRGRSSVDVRAVVVTGSAGAGKSSVLGRLVVLSDQVSRPSVPPASIAAGTDPGVGTVHVAIHARHKTIEDVVSGIAAATGGRATSVEELLIELGRRVDPVNVVIDALDEAGSVDDDEPARIASGLLRGLSRLPSVRLLVGSRRPVLPALGDGFQVVDLDEPRWVTHADIAAYARKLLLEPHGPGSTSRYSEQAARSLADDITRRCYPNYLSTRLTARALAARTEVAPDWARAVPSPTDTGRMFRWALHAQLGAQERLARDLLTPLAFAEGFGLPHGALWPAVAAAISGRSVSTADMRWLFGQAGSHIVEAVDELGRSVYRLYHESFADRLRADAPAGTQSRIVDALLGQVPVGPDWLAADPYIRTHLASHAAAAGRLDDLIVDPGFLLAATRAQLLRALPTARDTAIAAAYRHSAALLNEQVPLGERASILEVAAHMCGAGGLRDAMRNWPDRPWRVRWSDVTGETPLRRIGLHDNEITAVGAGELAGAAVLVTADAAGNVCLWQVETGDQIGGTVSLHTDAVVGVALLQTPYGPAVVSAGKDELVRVWYPGARQPPTSMHTGGDVERMACAVVDGRIVVATANMSGRVRIWDVMTGTQLGQARVGFFGRGCSLEFTRWGGRPALVAVDQARFVVLEVNGRTITDRQSEHMAFVAQDIDGQPTLVSVSWGEKRKEFVKSGVREIVLPADYLSVGVVSFYGATGMLVSQGNEVMFAGYMDGRALLWHVGSGEFVGSGSFVLSRSLFDLTAVVPVALTSQDTTMLVVPGGRSALAMNLDLLTGDARTDTQVNSVVVSVESGSLVVYSTTGDRYRATTLRTHDAIGGRLLRESTSRWEQAVNAFFGGGVGPSATPVFAHAETLDGELRVLGWSNQVWVVQKPKRMHIPRFSAVRVGGDVVIVAVGGKRLVYFHTNDGVCRYRRVPYMFDGMALLLDGQVAIASVGRLKPQMVWLGNGKRLWQRNQGEVDAVLCVGSVRGREAAAFAARNGQVHVLDARTGSSVCPPLIGNTQVAESGDLGEINGRPILVTGGRDRTLRVWDVDTGAQLTLIDVGTVVSAVRLVPGAAAVLVGTEVGLLRIDLGSGQKTGQPLTPGGGTRSTRTW